MTKKSARHISGVASDLIKRWQSHKFNRANAVRSAWREAAPKEAGAHTQPASFKNGVVMVIVENSSWAYKLTLEKRNILEKFNEKYPGRTKARDIRFRVGRIEGTS